MELLSSKSALLRARQTNDSLFSLSFLRLFSSYIFFSTSSVFASAPWSSLQKYIPILFLEHLNFENQLRMKIGCDEREIGRKLDGESPRKPDLNSF